MLAFLEATGGDLSHYFYGGAPGVAEEMARRLTVRFPGLRVAGIHSPPFTEALPVDPAEVKRLNASGADVVWVGLGHPKQDLWVHAYREHLDAPALMAVGAAFDFHAGAVKEAPAWMKRSGLQWLHRLASDPKRLWRRYLIGNSRFLWLLVIERLKARRA
jgi:N-acetylglucosaminyldiphosphoundecaprenol N-acetyl-beta-D-mannosaminyltransferase